MGYLKEINVFVVSDLCLLDFYYGEERLPVHVAQIEIFTRTHGERLGGYNSCKLS